MNKFKIYLRTKENIEEMANLYASTFLGKVIKKSFLNKGDVELNDASKSNPLWNYANVQIVGDLTIMIAQWRKEMPKLGYGGDLIITLESKDDFINIFEKMKNSPNFKMDYAPRAYDWGTTITKFYDKYGYGWVIETKTK